MPYIPNTPESLLSRADSKNPVTTCRGITGNGRPCRRALASSKPSSPAHHRTSSSQQTLTNDMNGVFAVAHDANDNDDVMTAAFFCWQHRDQAARMLHVKKEEVTEVQGRSSLDTLVERFGVLEVKEDGVMKVVKKARLSDDSKTGGKRMSGQKPAHQERPPHYYNHYESTPPQRREPERRPATPSIWSLLCCFTPSTFEHEDEHPLNYRNEKHYPPPSTYISRPQMTTTLPSPIRRPRDYHSLTRPSPTATAFPPLRPRATSASPQSAHPSPTYDFSTPSSLIPTHLPAATQKQLMNELTKPLSAKDEEGYIYVFQLDREAASPPEKHEEGKTLMVKIGRTTNVHRRLSSWTKQCGHTLTLLRFYPYVSSTASSPTSPQHPASPTSPNTPRKLPYSHRVERLIHIELAASNVKKDKCEGCGKEHKEWFEIQASREGVKGMDEVVRRWVGWGEWMGRSGNVEV